MHLERVKNSLKWNHIFLRYSMASLSWKERQLIEETQNEGMMEGLWQSLPKDKGFRKLLDNTNSVALSIIIGIPSNSTISLLAISVQRSP
jgi:hypothetical protein